MLEYSLSQFLMGDKNNCYYNIFLEKDLYKESNMQYF